MIKFICPNVNTCVDAYGCWHAKPHERTNGALYLKPCFVESHKCPACREYEEGEIINRLPSPKEAYEKEVIARYNRLSDNINVIGNITGDTSEIVSALLGVLDGLNKEIRDLKLNRR